MIATITNRRKARCMIIDETLSSDRLIAFLESLIKDAGRKFFLSLDSLRLHHSKPSKTWLTPRTTQIKVFYLPSSSLEINPEDRLNVDPEPAMGKPNPAGRGSNTALITAAYRMAVPQTALKLIGMRVVRDVPAGTPLDWSLLREAPN